MTAVLNFNAGPAMLPPPVLAQVKEELLSYRGLGMSIMEMSHRSKEYEEINQQASNSIRRLLGLGEDYQVLFLQGGASGQFAMIPMNFLPAGQSADYLVMGTWGEKAQEEAANLGKANIAASTRSTNYSRVPEAGEICLDPKAAYIHITTNETIHGVQWHTIPQLGDRPLVADMSSDFLSRPVDGKRFDLIYAGAQKNIGPAGVVAVAIRQAFLEKANKGIPTIFRYSTHAKNNSLYNTPPSLAVYVVNLVLQWIEKQGGLKAIEETNQKKASLIYDCLDLSSGFYKGHAEPGSRSQMNITFRLPSEDLEKEFVKQAQKEGMVGLAGHRSVGGIRASTYNAVPLSACQTLADFMKTFAKRA